MDTTTEYKTIYAWVPRITKNGVEQDYIEFNNRDEFENWLKELKEEFSYAEVIDGLTTAKHKYYSIHPRFNPNCLISFDMSILKSLSEPK